MSRTRVSRPVLGSVAAGVAVVVPEPLVPLDDVPAVPEPEDPDEPPEVCGAGVRGWTSPSPDDPEEPEFEPDESSPPFDEPESLSPKGSEYCWSPAPRSEERR